MKRERRLKRTFKSITNSFENFTGDGVERLGKFVAVYFNKMYGSELKLLDVVTNYTQPVVVVRTFEFNYFMYKLVAQNGILNFFDQNRKIYQIDLSPYVAPNSPAELMQILNDKYLVSSLLYKTEVDIDSIVGRYGDDANSGLIIRRKLIRARGSQDSQIRGSASTSHLSVALPAQQLLAA